MLCSWYGSFTCVGLVDNFFENGYLSTPLFPPTCRPGGCDQAGGKSSAFCFSITNFRVSLASACIIMFSHSLLFQTLTTKPDPEPNLALSAAECMSPAQQETCTRQSNAGKAGWTSVRSNHLSFSPCSLYRQLSVDSCSQYE